MLRNRMTIGMGISCLVLALAPRSAHAIQQVCNTATVNYTNSATTAITPVLSSTCFDAQSNPLLSVVKSTTKFTASSGDVIVYTVTISYPKLVLGAPDPGLCNDDSAALNIVVTDPLPGGASGVTYIPNTLQYSFNGGAFVAKTDAGGDDELKVTGSTVSTDLGIPVLNEGDGDGSCAGQTTRVIRIRYAVTKN